MNDSIALSELAEVRHRSMRTCAALRRRSKWRPPYALTTALELQSVELPRLPSRHTHLIRSVVVAVPGANAKYRVGGVHAVIWSFPMDVVTVDRRFACVSPVCTWMMFAAYLGLEELIVLGDAMMRRDGRLRRATADEFAAHLDGAVSHAREEGIRMFPGYANCRRALRLIRAGTDSSMETRTRLVPLKYGLDCPQVNYPIVLRGGRSVYLDLAYPEFKICIEYDGVHHAGRWLNDVRRRQAIEDEGWKYIQVTMLDIGDEGNERALANRIAERIREVTGKPVELSERRSIRRLCDARGLRRKPLYERLRFAPLLPVTPSDGVDDPAKDVLDTIA